IQAIDCVDVIAGNRARGGPGGSRILPLLPLTPARRAVVTCPLRLSAQYSPNKRCIWLRRILCVRADRRDRRIDFRDWNTFRLFGAARHRASTAPSRKQRPAWRRSSLVACAQGPERAAVEHGRFIWRS